MTIGRSTKMLQRTAGYVLKALWSDQLCVVGPEHRGTVTCDTVSRGCLGLGFHPHHYLLIHAYEVSRYLPCWETLFRGLRKIGRKVEGGNCVVLGD